MFIDVVVWLFLWRQFSLLCWMHFMLYQLNKDGAFQIWGVQRFLPENDNLSSTLWFHLLLLLFQQLDNILYTDRGVLKVTDFGLSSTFKPGTLVYGKQGTHGYMAPEIYSENGYNGPPVDVWALGVVLHLLINNKCPFSRKTMKVSDPVLQSSESLRWCLYLHQWLQQI